MPLAIGITVRIRMIYIVSNHNLHQVCPVFDINKVWVNFYKLGGGTFVNWKEVLAVSFCNFNNINGGVCGENDSIGAVFVKGDVAYNCIWLDNSSSRTSYCCHDRIIIEPDYCSLIVRCNGGFFCW